MLTAKEESDLILAILRAADALPVKQRPAHGGWANTELEQWVIDDDEGGFPPHDN